MAEIYVREYMTSPAASIGRDARLLDAALTMRRSGFRHLPIVDGERLVGIITDRDIQRFAPSLLGNVSQEEYNAIFEETPLEKVMTKNPISVSADTTPMGEAAAILHDKKLGCVPVVDGEKLIGIITVTDMLRLLHNLLTGPGETLDTTA
ncbi:MAG: CBS domain-containing protein [Acidobacteria bacterium]|nr:CBS domain-containing protein [Acidobacteriota bacterium]